MPVGKKDKKCPSGTQKSPVRQHRGFFIPFWQDLSDPASVKSDDLPGKVFVSFGER